MATPLTVERGSAGRGTWGVPIGQPLIDRYSKSTPEARRLNLGDL